MLTLNSSVLEHISVGLILCAGRAGPGGLPGAAEPALATGLTACAGQEQQLGLQRKIWTGWREGDGKGGLGCRQAARRQLSTDSPLVCAGPVSSSPPTRAGSCLHEQRRVCPGPLSDLPNGAASRRAWASWTWLPEFGTRRQVNFSSKYKTRQAFGWDFCGGCCQRRKQSDVHHRFLLIMIISVARLRKLTEPGRCLLPQPLQDGVGWGGISLGRGGQATWETCVFMWA